MNNAIEINNLSKLYDDVHGVKDITLNIKEGEIFGFIGQNGAGKSTTIRTLLNFIFPTSGSAKILGYDVVSDSKKIKEFLSYVPSEVSYYRNFRVIDLLKYSLALNGGDQKRIDDLCDYLELDNTRLISELSLGNRKKVSIVQALLKQPKVIILDEPTSGLDPLIQEKLFKLLLDEKKKGTCIFLSSHNLTEVEKYCDRLAIIKNGLIVRVDDIKNLNIKRKLRVTYEENNVEKTFIYEDDINKLIVDLSKKKLSRLEITHVSLEEEFMQYYKEV